MAENQALLVQLQRKNASIQRLLTPSLKQTAGTQPFAGRKFQVAARKMRVLTADGPSLTNRGQITSLSTDVVHRFQNVETGLHINPKMLQAKNKTWDGVERVFHGSGTVQAKRESAPAMPGEMRQGSIIPRMETFPKPGQPIEAFRQQIESTPRPSRTPEPAKKAVIAPKSRLFTKVEEISRQPAKPAPADEPDPPSLSLRSPPATPDAPVQRKTEQMEPPSAAPVIQRALDLPDPVSFEAGKSSEIAPASTTSAPPNLPVTVARKAETVSPSAPKPAAPVVTRKAEVVQPPSAPAVALPAKQVSRSPLQDQPLKPPAAKAVQRKEEFASELPAPQNASSELASVPSFTATPPAVSLPAQSIQRAAIENEPDDLSGLPAENKEPMSEETMVQAKLIQPKPVTPAPVLPVAAASPVSSPALKVDAPKTPIAQAKPVQRQAARPLQAKLVQAKAAESVKPVLSAPQPGPVSATVTQVQGSSPSVTAPVALVQRAASKDAEETPENATSTASASQIEDAVADAVIARKEIMPSPVQRSESQGPVEEEKPLVQAKRVQRQQDAPVAEEEAPLLQAKLVQRQSAEPVDEEEIASKPLVQAKLVQRESVEPVVEEEIARKPLVQAKLVQRESAEPVVEEEIARKPIVQAKLVQRESAEPVDKEEIARKPIVQLKPVASVKPLLQAKPVSLPLATQNRILPVAQNAVQRVEHSNAPIAPVEEDTAPGAMPLMGFPSIARSVDKPEGFSSGNSLIRRMPLVEKIHSRPRVESLLRSADSEPTAARINQPALVQRQSSALVQAEKYQSVAMPAVLPDMALPRSSAASAVSPAVSMSAAPMTLARKVEAGAVPAAPFAAPMQQAAMPAGIENAFSGMLQRTITDQPSPAAGATPEQVQPGEAGKDKAKSVDLNALAEDIFPIVKRLLEIAADRSGGGFR